MPIFRSAVPIPTTTTTTTTNGSEVPSNLAFDDETAHFVSHVEADPLTEPALKVALVDTSSGPSVDQDYTFPPSPPRLSAPADIVSSPSRGYLTRL
jgi:hypothetical protein